MAKFKVTANTGSVEIEAYDIEEAIRKFKDLNNSAEIESVEKKIMVKLNYIKQAHLI